MKEQKTRAKEGVEVLKSEMHQSTNQRLEFISFH